MTLESFSRRITLRADELGQSVDRIVRTAALVVDQVVVLATPVDTGRARSNWLVSVGVPRGGVIEPYSPGNQLGLGENANANGALQQARTAVLVRPEGVPIYIVNNVEYLPQLNNGSSQQAPANFVEIGVEQAIGAIQASRVFIRR